jgi:hypothetical protein
MNINGNIKKFMGVTIFGLGSILAMLFAAPGAKAQPAGFRWVFATNGYVPSGAIVGGWEQGRTLYVCRTWYGGGVHPGKVVGNNCNIGWGGKEITLEAYEVLVGDNTRVRWVDASFGGIPAGALSGGYEAARPDLFVCRAQYNGWQPGKIVAQNCNFGYGGEEKLSPYYQVLVTE